MLFKTLCKGNKNNLIMQLFMQKIKPQAIPSGAVISEALYYIPWGHRWRRP